MAKVRRYVGNLHVRGKIRQQLQVLRALGLVAWFLPNVAQDPLCGPAAIPCHAGLYARRHWGMVPQGARPRSPRAGRAATLENECCATFFYGYSRPRGPIRAATLGTLSIHGARRAAAPLVQRIEDLRLKISRSSHEIPAGGAPIYRGDSA